MSISYKEQEFYRIGYYVYNNYNDPELLENSPQEIQIDKIYRNILADKPIQTRFDIKWGFEDEMKKEEENGILKENTGESNKLGEINNHLATMMGTDTKDAGFKDFSIGMSFNNPFLNQTNTFGINENSIANGSISHLQDHSADSLPVEKNPFF